MKRFRNWEEAKNYSYPKESKSNYYCVKVDDEKDLPTPQTTKRGEFGWRICQPTNNECGVFIEVTPLWVTITIQKKNITKKRDFALKGKTVQNILYEAFK
jgi:hypothetical protein